MIDSTELSFDAVVEAAQDGQLIFGGPGGEFRPVGDVGGQQLSLYGGSLVDMIQIGGTKYGGGGGGLTGSAKIPVDGRLYIKELGTRSRVVSYMRVTVGSTEIQAGSRDGSDALLILPDLCVRFAGIGCGTYVDRLIFDVVA